MSSKSLLTLFAVLSFLVSSSIIVSCGKKDKSTDTTNPVVTLKGAAV